MAKSSKGVDDAFKPESIKSIFDDPTSPEQELDKLKSIVLTVESLDENARQRVFGYLKSKYSKYIPTDYN